MTLTFNMLLRDAGIEPYNVRLARHVDRSKEAKRSPYSLWRSNVSAFELYQRIQGRNKFRVGGYLASFVVTPLGQTLFVGIYRVDALGTAPEGTLCPVREIDVCGFHLYEMSRDERMSDLIGRLSIDWGLGALSWVQLSNRREKRVIEIRKVFEEEPFPGFFHFSCKLSDVGDLPATWIQRLKEARGVYILTSLRTATHYVGSATGMDGFYGRWASHAAVGEDAVGLKGLQPSDYQVSILAVSAGFDSEGDIVRNEQAWMRKLHSRSMGHNGSPATAKAPDAD